MIGVEIGYGIARRHQGRGYATAAVRLLVADAFALSPTPDRFSPPCAPTTSLPFASLKNAASPAMALPLILRMDCSGVSFIPGAEPPAGVGLKQAADYSVRICPWMIAK